ASDLDRRVVVGAGQRDVLRHLYPSGRVHHEQVLGALVVLDDELAAGRLADAEGPVHHAVGRAGGGLVDEEGEGPGDIGVVRLAELEVPRHRVDRRVIEVRLHEVEQVRLVGALPGQVG